jgi:hypothetical protein
MAMATDSCGQAGAARKSSKGAELPAATASDRGKSKEIVPSDSASRASRATVAAGRSRSASMNSGEGKHTMPVSGVTTRGITEGNAAFGSGSSKAAKLSKER